MTARRLVYLSCDGTGCGDALGEYDNATVAEARATARALGWTRRGVRDLCEGCTGKEARRDVDRLG